MFRRATDSNREAQKILHSRNVKFDEGERVVQLVVEEEAEVPTSTYLWNH